MKKWLSVIGIGEDGLEGVSPAGRALINGADVVIGGDRHLAMLPENHPARRMTWRSPLTDTIDDIKALEGKPVVVLATGDPMSFGIGVTLGRAFGHEPLTVLPAVGAFSLAAARLGWPLQAADVDCLTLHGRPLEMVNLHLRPGARLLILAEDGGTAETLARHLCEMGYGDSQITVLEHLDGEKENHVSGMAREWNHPRGADLNTIAVICLANPETKPLSRLAGLPDEAFTHDGQLTKREVRAATLASLAPQPGELLWDVGGGCGSIAIEWMRAGGRAIIIEKNPARIAMIRENANKLGVPFLKIIEGSAPETLADLPGPDAVFIGGGLTADGIFESCWNALGDNGRLAANAVTLEGEAKLLEWREKWGGQMSRIAVSREQAVGPLKGWKPLMAVTRLIAFKG